MESIARTLPVPVEFDPRRIENAVQRMLARPRFSVSGELRTIVITALWQYLDRREPHPAFTVDEWDDKGNRRRIVAGVNDLTVAHAAYAAAIEKWPDSKLTLRKGAWMIREWPKRE